MTGRTPAYDRALADLTAELGTLTARVDALHRRLDDLEPEPPETPDPDAADHDGPLNPVPAPYVTALRAADAERDRLSGLVASLRAESEALARERDLARAEQRRLGDALDAADERHVARHRRLSEELGAALGARDAHAAEVDRLGFAVARRDDRIADLLTENRLLTDRVAELATVRRVLDVTPVAWTDAAVSAAMEAYHRITTADAPATPPIYDLWRRVLAAATRAQGPHLGVTNPLGDDDRTTVEEPTAAVVATGIGEPESREPAGPLWPHEVPVMPLGPPRAVSGIRTSSVNAALDAWWRTHLDGYHGAAARAGMIARLARAAAAYHAGFVPRSSAAPADDVDAWDALLPAERERWRRYAAKLLADADKP